MALSYTTVARIRQQHPLIGSMTTLSSNQIFEFTTDAEAMINAKISKQYTVPVTDVSVPPLLTTIATDLSVYRILTQRVFTQERLKDSVWPDRFKEAQDILDEIADGKIALTEVDGSLVPTRSDVADVWSNTKDYEPTFTELGDLDHVVDPDKIDDLKGDRGL